MSKKGENIHKRKDGRWEGRYKKGRKDNGDIIYGSVYGKTYRAVREKLTLITNNVEYTSVAKSQEKNFERYWSSGWIPTESDTKELQKTGIGI